MIDLFEYHKQQTITEMKIKDLVFKMRLIEKRFDEYHNGSIGEKTSDTAEVMDNLKNILIEIFEIEGIEEVYSSNMITVLKNEIGDISSRGEVLRIRGEIVGKINKKNRDHIFKG